MPDAFWMEILMTDGDTLMKSFLIATTMFAAAAAPAFADEPPVVEEEIGIEAETEVNTDTDMDGDDLSQDMQQAWDDADLDRDPFTDDHAWIETNVYGSEGEILGEVERVRLTAEGDVDAIVVETGGVLEIGGREVLIEVGEYELTSVEDENRLVLTVNAAGFAALPDFNEDAASEYPLSDDDFNDDESDLTDGPDMDDMDVLEDDEIADPSR
ncbi:MAG TPA: hypothetical protein DCQ53_15910 [Alphaproteobacteria bacterium]|nr:hypothetical protein [Alphaproteobacteria bacterium]